MKIVETLRDLVRGFLIGVAEVIPGVSGGTIALIVGIYQRIIDSAAAVTKAGVAAVRFKPSDARAQFFKAEWRLLIPVGIGMLGAIVIASAILEPLLESETEVMRGLFFGMILVSLYVPLTMVGGKWRLGDYLVGLLAAGISFGLMSLPRATEFDPSLLIVFFGAAFAVCALVLPGVSGSFLLLALGLYAPTIAAVNDRNLLYLGVFILGAIAGLASFSTLLSWLLSQQRRLTLTVMTGLMLGSLRALWPWQTEAGAVLEPFSFSPWIALIGGVVIVGGLIIWQNKLQSSGRQ